MDDRQVEFESEALVGRYEISTDHDQDQVRAWQLFDPSVIRWLVDGAPDDFSFELQDGALCGFVPGALGEAGELDALCEATATVHTRVRRDRRGPGHRARGGGQPRRLGGARARRAPVLQTAAQRPLGRPPFRGAA